MNRSTSFVMVLQAFALIAACSSERPDFPSVLLATASSAKPAGNDSGALDAGRNTPLGNEISCSSDGFDSSASSGSHTNGGIDADTGGTDHPNLSNKRVVGQECQAATDCASGVCAVSWDDAVSICCETACTGEERCGSTGACQECSPGDQVLCWELIDGTALPTAPQKLAGNCKNGVRTCSVEGTWLQCVGAVAPEAEDDCSKPGADNDCNGTANEGCLCTTGDQRGCGTDTGNCVAGMQRCDNGTWGLCEGEVAPATEDSCATKDDDANCNGTVNEGCKCIGEGARTCGDCGEQTCNVNARDYDACKAPAGTLETTCQSESTLLSCGPQGAWVPRQCTFLCSVDACAGECVRDETRCSTGPERRETCVGGTWTTTEQCALGGSCVGGGTQCVKANGQTCLSASECASSNCVDGMCCNSVCDSTCMACSAALTGGNDGECAGIDSGTDPQNECTAQATSTCGANGMCNGSGACALFNSITQCATPSCLSGAANSARLCNGMGTCLAATQTACGAYACGGTACRTDCTVNSQCSSGNVCVAGVCNAPSGLQGVCDEDADCSAGECLGGVCSISIVSIRIAGTGVSGGGDPHSSLTGWFTCDSTGHNLVRVSSIPAAYYLYQDINLNQTMDSPLPPNTYLVLESNESSNSLTRDFTFNFSDGTSITKSVTANSSASIVLTEFTGDVYKLFQWTGTTINVLSKTY